MIIWRTGPMGDRLLYYPRLFQISVWYLPEKNGTNFLTKIDEALYMKRVYEIVYC
jgi:hypothetical protein